MAELRRINGLVGATRHDPEASIDHDTEFHRGIYAAAENPILTALLDSLQHLGRRTRGLTIVRDEINERVVAQHAAIVDAIEAGDTAAAARSMVVHLQYVRATLTAAAEDGAS